MKHIFSSILIVMMILTLSGCGSTQTPDTDSSAGSGSQSASLADSDSGSSSAVMPQIPADELKIGVIYIGDPSEGSGYTYTHEQGIVAMRDTLGLSDDQIVRKTNVDSSDASAIESAMLECIEEGCQMIFATSWGYMDTCEALAE